jgi:hypothetical protein
LLNNLFIEMAATGQRGLMPRLSVTYSHGAMARIVVLNRLPAGFSIRSNPQLNAGDQK